MNRLARVAFFIAASFALVACSGGGKPAAPAVMESRLMVTTSTTVIDPASGSAPAVDLAALGAARVEAHYRLTTPANQRFAFDLVSWQPDAEGATFVSATHLRDGGAPPAADGWSLMRAGMFAIGSGLSIDGVRTAAAGDGFARLTLKGMIASEQMIAVGTGGEGVVVVTIAIGAPSVINSIESTEPPAPGVISRDTIYSSDSPLFGMPTIAVSGDRTSVVCYEGDRSIPPGPSRYELRLQHDRQTGAVTGGATPEPSATAGQWRDHEIVALYNVLGVVRAEEGGVRMRLSFDRGATFAQDVQLMTSSTQTRLVQAAMAGDYSVAIGAWRSRPEGTGADFLLIEGRAVAFDTSGSPTWFQFDAPVVVHAVDGAVAPLTTGIAWSQGGDLVVGYAYNRWNVVFQGEATFRCATRRWGGELTDSLVDRRVIFGMDPTVAVLGHGASLRIVYAYETQSGLALASSEDGGASFQLAAEFGVPGDHLPTVFAREIGGQTRVDVLFLAYRAQGPELHRCTWADWPSSPPTEDALTTAQFTSTPFFASVYPPLPFEFRSTEIGFLGYDAVLDGDDIVVAYDEVTRTCSWWMWQFMNPGAMTMGSGGIFLPPIYSPASPPPLAPGLTQPMPAPDAAHSHQLKLLRLQ